MQTSIDPTRNEINQLRSTLQDLSTRLVVTETQLKVILEEREWKLMWSKARAEFMRMVFFVVGISVVVLIGLFVMAHWDHAKTPAQAAHYLPK